MALFTPESQAKRKQLLAFNQELRKEAAPMALPDNSGYLQFFMPELDYYFWIHKNPDLRAPDSEIRKRAWTKFLRSDDGRKYTVNPNEGRQLPNHGIIVR